MYRGRSLGGVRLLPVTAARIRTTGHLRGMDGQAPVLPTLATSIPDDHSPHGLTEGRTGTTRREVMAPHVLVVDDESDFRLSLNLLLGLEGFRVSEASDGHDALAQIDGGLRPDVILLDYRMPGWNGGETLQQLQARSLGIPVVLLSAASDAQQLAEQHGFDAFLRKPIWPDDLLAVLRRFLSV